MSSFENKVIPMLEEILSRLAHLEGNSGGKTAPGGGAAAGGGGGDVPRSVSAYDQYFSSYVEPFVASSAKLGGDAQKAGVIVKEAFEELRKVLLMAATCKEPPQDKLPAVLAGISAKVKAASGLIQRNEWEKHTKTVSEGIGCLNW
jgi:adenylyl cyclase-associated protein